MRSNRTLIMLAIALVAGLLAAWLSVRWMDSQVRTKTQATAVNATKVAVAADVLRSGRELTDKAYQMVDWPSSSVPPGAITDPSGLSGRVVKAPIAKGEPILESKLAPKGAKGGLAAVLSPGKRAISVGVNEVVGVAAESLEGSFVDVMVNSTDTTDAERQRSISKIVLERVKVLAVPQAQPGSSRINAVTLEVTPAEAERIDLARSVGTLSLMLRSQDEPDVAGNGAVSRGATKEALFGGPVRPAAPPPAPRVVAAPREAPAPAPAPVAAPAPAAPQKPRVCVDAYVGSERRSECF
jgi:pilus assembly protein CpaB